MRRYLVRAVRRSVTDKATEPMRKALTQTKKKNLTKAMEERNAELELVWVLIDVVHAILHNMPSNDSARQIGQEVLSLQSEFTYTNPRGGTEKLLDFFTSMSKGGDDWRARVPNVAQVALDIYTKRSGAFKHVKSGMLQALVASSAEKEKKWRSEFEQKVSALRKEYESEKVEGKEQGKGKKAKAQESGELQVRVQNVDGLNEINKLKSDAERKRIPFQVSGLPVSQEKHNAMVARVTKSLSTAAAASTSAASSSSSAASDKTGSAAGKTAVAESGAQAAMHKAVEGVVGNEKAVQLARLLHKVTFATISSTANFKGTTLLETIFAYLRVPAGERSVAIRKIIEILMLNWQDVVEGEKCAARWLEDLYERNSGEASAGESAGEDSAGKSSGEKGKQAA